MRKLYHSDIQRKCFIDYKATQHKNYTNIKHMFKMVEMNWSREKLKLTKSERVAFVVPGRITIDSQYSLDDSQYSRDGNYFLTPLNKYLQELGH